MDTWNENATTNNADYGEEIIIPNSNFEKETIKHGPKNEDTWDREKVKLLLNSYLERLHQFKSSNYVKKFVWDEIGIILGKSGETCDKKFRNLKQTYIRLLKNKKRTSIRWPYFDMFNNIFSDGLDINEPEIVIIQSLEDNSQEEISIPLQISSHNVPVRKRKRYETIHKMTEEVHKKQEIIENKLDHMISILEESNNIQKERNDLFQQYLALMLNKT